MNGQDHADSARSPAGTLRLEAERRLRNQSTPAEGTSEADVRALVHELEVHQIELEMQNEELQRAQAATEEASAKYIDLFDFAPVAYFLWDHEGRISEVNLAGAALLGLDRGRVLHRRFDQFVTPKHRATFADFCRRVTLADTRQTCEVQLLNEGHVVDVLIESLAVQTGNGQNQLYHAAIINITLQKRIERALRRKQRLLRESLQIHDYDRQVMAYEIHDGLAQLLIGAKMTFESCEGWKESSPQKAGERFTAGLQLLKECIAEARRLINGVRPPLLDEQGVVVAVENLLRVLSRDGGPEIVFQPSEGFGRLDPAIENAAYRIVQESTCNARQHSGTQKIRVGLERVGARVRITVQDWGSGFDFQKTKRSGKGLCGIHARARLLGGKATIETSAGNGTKVIVDLPARWQEEDPTST